LHGFLQNCAKKVCKKTSEISAGQSWFRRCLTPPRVDSIPSLCHRRGIRGLKKVLCSRWVDNLRQEVLAKFDHRWERTSENLGIPARVCDKLELGTCHLK
jgi:hypothetical protein